ncbi:MAG TPA: twin-arginine translocation signal domain-containing protein [Candidatus Acidoferrum sp.]|nr:twin-arginine translocation signal domain-containing protein [Candidatus Acidoferrum sp.]
MQTMKEKNAPSVVVSETNSAEASKSSIEEGVQRRWQGVVQRRSFLKGLGLAGAALSAGSLLASEGAAQSSSSTGKLSKGDAALLQFALWAELVESDLWTQYAELGGVGPSGGGAAQAGEEFQGFIGGNPAYTLALQNLDGDMPQYITDNTDDELSHAAFLAAYLKSRGEVPLDLTPFKNLPSSRATGARQIKRLTNLMNLNVDLSWYTRYRSGKNPDLGAVFKGPLVITNQPAIPLNDTDTPPSTNPTIPITGRDAQRIQAIANTAGFHFAFIEQGGASLYPTLAFKATDPTVLQILVSIGGVEIDHFGLWHDKGGNAVSQPLAGVVDPVTGLTFPDLNNPATELTQTNKILPEPCSFISKSLPRCSVIRPTSTQNGGAVATVNAFTEDGLFIGQPTEFFELSMQLAVAADSARRG